MNKTFLLLTTAVLLFVSCAKENLSRTAENEELVTFTVAVSDVRTRAVTHNDGEAAEINHWIMEVIDGDGALYNRQEKDGETGEKHQTFEVAFVKNQTYTVLFWADTKGVYNTESLRDIKLKDGEAGGYEANLDSRDAFSAVVANFESTSSSSSNDVTLTRPFAQMNVVFTDLKKLYETMGSNLDEYNKFTPENFQAVAKIPTSFNVMTQTAGNPASTALTNTAAANYCNNYDAHTGTDILYMDYIFATAGSKDIVDVNFSFTSNGSNISHNFTSIPFQRNYRTNILGDFMTSNSQWNVTVDPLWSGEHSTEYASEGSIAAANKALKEGKTSIEICNPADVDAPVTFPVESDGKDININITGVSGKTVAFVVDANAQGPANLTVRSNADNLNINTPNTHVIVATGSYTGVTAATSATTLVVGKDVSIGTLDVSSGNIEIHGLVTTVTKASGSVITYVVETADVLRDVAAKINATAQETPFPKVFIDADIDLNNEAWTPINGWFKNLYIDGRNHTVRNLKITGTTEAYIGFVGVATGATIKNLTFDGADLSYPVSSGKNARAGVVAGQIYGSLVDNCHVKNATIVACQKTGGLIGFLEGNSNTPYVVKDCSVEKVSISSNDPGNTLQHGVGGLIGHISLSNNPLITVTGCSVKDITIEDYPTAYSLQIYPGLFIGNACTNHTGTEVSDISSHSIVLSNNTVSGTNTVLPTSIYSSPYFAWAGNAEERPDWKGSVFIDGEKWVPDYPFECSGMKYATLGQAVSAAAATQEKTVNIVKTGEYVLSDIGQNVTISGMDGVSFNCVGNGSICSIPNGVTFKNINFIFGNSNYHGFYHAGKIDFKDCVINGLLFGYGTLEFDSCTFNQETTDVYSLHTYGSDVTVRDCEFFGTNKAILLYTEALSKDQNVIVEDCQFHASAVEDLKAAVQMNAVANASEYKYICTVSDCTVEGFQKVYGFKHNPSRVNATVTVDGKLVYADGKLLSLKTSDDLVEFSAAVKDGYSFSGKTVYVENDIDLTGIIWESVGKTGSTQFMGTFNGQNHTISNLTINNTDESKYCATGFFGWLNTATVKNVRISDANVSGYHNVGVIAGYMEANSYCTIDNCIVTGASVSCTHKNDDADGDKCGGIVGYAVNSGVVVSNCSVIDTEINAGRDAGQVAGAAKEANVTGCSATNVNVTANGTGTGANIRNEIIGRIL